MSFLEWNFKEWRNLSVLRISKSSFFDDLHSFRSYRRNLKKSVMTRYEVWKLLNIGQSKIEYNRMIKVQKLEGKNKHHRRKDEIKYKFRENLIKGIKW